VGALKDILEKVSGKIEGWRAKTLSQAGRTVLFKSVDASIPSYVMSSFLCLYLLALLWTKCLKTFGGDSQRIKLEISL
jgi:hypothetical protein